MKTQESCLLCSRNEVLIKNVLKETHNSYFCLALKNQALHESASLFLK